MATVAAHPTSSVGPPPTFTPGPVLEDVYESTEIGRRTLW